MSEHLIVYFSRTGSTEAAAKKLAGHLGCDICEISSPKTFSGFFGFIAGGRAAMREFEIPINGPALSPDNYESVVICTPVWASNIPPAVRTWLKEYGDKVKAHSLLLCSSGSDYIKPLQKIECLIGGAEKLIHFSAHDRKQQTWESKLRTFATELKA